MNRQEFLDTLKKSLNGEISASSVEDNINYYNNYISTNKPGEEAITLQELGDPRLIARTIIETERLSKSKGKFGEDFSQNKSYQYEYEQEKQEDKDHRTLKNILWSNLTLIQKLTIITTLVLTIFILVILGKVIFKLIITFAFPILFILLLFSLFRKRS